MNSRFHTTTYSIVRPASRRAFSLLELTLVLVILGVLGAVAAVNILGAGERAKVRATETSMRTIENAIKSYMLDEGSAPADISALVSAKYLEGRSTKDAWKREWFYRPGDSTGNYVLMSLGPDPEDRADDIDLRSLDQE